MARLLIHVEGETEEGFVNEALAPHLFRYGYQKISARLIGNARNRFRRGGIRSWPTVRVDILNHLKEDPECLTTLMVDYYALPKEGSKAWPGRNKVDQLPFPQKAPTVKTALLTDISGGMGRGFDPGRFIPYVMMHEFEGLLFSDCQKFSLAIGRPELASQLQAIRNGFATPEEINDSPFTAPSKRVKTLVPEYEKPLFGALAVLEIGLAAIRAECPLFRQWLESLEAWPK